MMRLQSAVDDLEALAERGEHGVTHQPSRVNRQNVPVAIFSPIPVPSDRFAKAARPAVLYVRMRVKNALQLSIEIKDDSIVFDNVVVGPWHP
ncbi:MAG: hypothetical protein WD397_02550 [Wenzhouxiangellaceae bacterium]